ncbi:hypothetical protein RINTHH_15680 [Richelia intracellularis HH01]|uniref:Uncharacterized protein n=1 Tax=Richelia intracellularis HH01 TaxID=1165094 RepID=M1X0W7_9NOST|nr:hypothetical protein RINTHH_15680 [Richelia intracellularis HH01]
MDIIAAEVEVQRTMTTVKKKPKLIETKLLYDLLKEEGYSKTIPFQKQ